MRTTISIIILLSFIYLNSCKAQLLASAKHTVQATKEAYAIDFVKGSQLIQIKNLKNKLSTKGMNPPENAPLPEPKDSKVDGLKIVRIFKTVFTPKRLQEVASDTDFMLVNFKTDTYGKLFEVSFAIKPTNSSIKPAEIEKLENLLKGGIQITLNHEVYKYYSYVVISRFVVFSKLYNNENDAVQ